MIDYILEAKNVKKSFGGLQALKGVNLQLKKKEIHCLAGENGSGKSTLIKIISGVYTMDSGSIIIDGKKHDNITPILAIRNGVQVIYQDFSLFQNLTVAENIAFNSEIADNRKLINPRAMKRNAEESMQKINFKIDLDAIVGELSVADKQMTAICRALTRDAKIIIMDEPTTALTNKEVESLFKTVHNLKDQGIAVLFVSHKMDEVFEISERFTILRNGKNVVTEDVAKLDHDKFVHYMTGRKFEKRNVYANACTSNGQPVLKVEKLSFKNKYKDISFELRKGDILGIAGLLGCGRDELALTLFGQLKPDKGEIFIKGKKININSVQRAINNNIGYVPQDRLTEGLFLTQSIGRNLIVTMIRKIANKVGIIQEKTKKQKIEKCINQLDINTTDPNNAAKTLSGGNQQRVVLGKWLALDLEILVLNGPTVGVDIGSKYDLHSILRQLADSGMAIIIISDDLPEVMANCNRVLIMREGKITEEVCPENITEQQLSDKIADTNDSNSSIKVRK